METGTRVALATVVAMELMADVAAKILKRLSLVTLILCLALFLLSYRKVLLSTPLEAKDGIIKNQSKNHVYGFGKNHQGLRLSYASIKNSLWLATDFSEAQISNSSLLDFTMYGGGFKKAKFYGTSISQSTFLQSDFSEMEIVGNLVENSRFLNVDFSRSLLQGTRFINCDLEASDFRGAKLAEVTFILSSLKSAVFNDETQLPFSKEEALTLGMVYVP